MAKVKETMAVVLSHDVWDNEGRRISAGPDVVELSKSLATKMVNAGKAKLAADD